MIKETIRVVMVLVCSLAIIALLAYSKYADSITELASGKEKIRADSLQKVIYQMEASFKTCYKYQNWRDK